MKWPFYKKDLNQIGATLWNFTNIRSKFVERASFLEANSPNILALCDTNLDDLIDSGNLSVRNFSLLLICMVLQ